MVYWLRLSYRLLLPNRRRRSAILSQILSWKILSRKLTLMLRKFYKDLPPTILIPQLSSIPSLNLSKTSTESAHKAENSNTNTKPGTSSVYKPWLPFIRSLSWFSLSRRSHKLETAPKSTPWSRTSLSPFWFTWKNAAPTPISESRPKLSLTSRGFN